MNAGRPAVFLDRDGTLCEEHDWVCKPEDLRLLPGAAQAVRKLNAAGIFVALVTNQSAVARGYIDIADLERIHAHLCAMLAEHGARIDAIEFCPHHPTEGQGEWRVECECRKPRDGMLRRLIARHGLDPARSFVIGDARRDMQSGEGLGIAGILVRTGKGAREAQSVAAGVAIVEGLPEAVELALARLQGR